MDMVCRTRDVVGTQMAVRPYGSPPVPSMSSFARSSLSRFTRMQQALARGVGEGAYRVSRRCCREGARQADIWWEIPQAKYRKRNTASSRARLPPALAVPPNTPKVLDNWGTEVWLREANFRGHFRVCVCALAYTIAY
jgi:hypothetical protein